MNRMRQKLKSQSGLSLIFALLIMMVVTMVSTTIVIASVTVVKRTNQIKEFRQRSLALESAALMIQKKIMSDDEQLEELLAVSMKEYRTYDGEKEVTGGPFFISTNIDDLPQVSVFYTIEKKDYDRDVFSDTSPEAGDQVVFTFQVDGDESFTDTLKLYCRRTEETWTVASF